MCISDSPKSTIVWNIPLNPTNTNFFKTDFTYELSRYPSHIEQCKIDVDSPNCFSKWGQHHANWSLTYSSDVPMGPVYDSRWEMYESYDYIPIKTYQNGKYSDLTFGETGALVFSIRGPGNAHLLLCESENLFEDFCYWIIIGGWNNSITAITKCENGVPITYPHKEYNCSELQTKIEHSPLSPYEWKTFVLTWTEKNRTLKLFDPDKMVLTYSDGDYHSTKSSTKLYHIFYRNPSTEMLFRFHNYSYTLTTQPGATLKSQPIVIEISQEICIDMLVGLCKQCQLDVSIIGLGKRRMTKRITRSPAYENIEHNLPMWQNEKIQSSSFSSFLTIITLELVAVLSSENTNKVGNHWAITKFGECLPKGTVRKMSIEATPHHWAEAFELDVTCQKLSNDHPNSEVVNINNIVTEPPNDLQYCVKDNIGPYCATNCQDYFENSCYSVTICKENGCFCPQGLENGPKGECTSACQHGSYGYGCTKKCSNCRLNDCNGYTGECDSGCKQIPDLIYVSPYCNIVIELPAKLYLDQIKTTSVRVYLYEKEYYKKINATFQFEIKTNSSDNNGQIAESTIGTINNISRKIYYAIFTDLTPGMNYSVRALINIKDEKNKQKLIEVKFATFTTLCNSPEAATIIDMKEKDKGTVYLKWRSPSITDGQIKKFLIHRNIISTELERNPDSKDTEAIHFPIFKYQIEYNTHINLLSSTHYNISIQAITKTQSGKLSSREIETKSSLAFQYEPHHFVVGSETSLIKIVIPPVINNTKGSTLLIAVKGRSICVPGGRVSPEIAKDIGVEKNEKAWRVVTYPTSETANLPFTIGDDLIYDGIVNCPLHQGNSYVIALVVREKKRLSGLHKPQTLIWRSGPIQIGPNSNQHYEYWATPLVLFIVVILGAFYYCLKRRDSYVI